MKMSYSYPGITLAILVVHYDKVMKGLNSNQINNPTRLGLV